VFEVASVRPTPPGAPRLDGPRPSDGPTAHQLSSGSFSYSSFTLLEYIQLAYGLKLYQIPNRPKDLVAQYDINAKAHGPITDGQARLMFQTLLEDRFKLKLHRESKDSQVWALAVAKGGPKFQHGADDGKVAGASLSAAGLQWHNISMDYLADWITNLPSLGRPVMNRTGLDGLYDLTLFFDSPVNGEDPAALKMGLRDALDASILGSLQDLGLKLESEKAPIDFYTVEHVEPPSEN